MKRLPTTVHKKIGHETNSGNPAVGAVVREGEGEVAKSKFGECRRSSGSAGPSLDTLFCFRLNCSQRSSTAMCSRTPLPLPDEHWAGSGCSSAIALARCSDCKSDHPVSCAIHGPGGITRGVDSNMPEPEESEAVKNRLRPAPFHRSQLSRAGSAFARLRTRRTRVRSDALVGAKECARVLLLACRASPRTPCGCLPKKPGPPSGMSWLRAWWLALYASSSSIL